MIFPESAIGARAYPADLTAFGAAVGRLLDHAALRARIGAAAQADCRRRFLIDRQLGEYLNAFWLR